MTVTNKCLGRTEGKSARGFVCLTRRKGCVYSRLTFRVAENWRMGKNVTLIKMKVTLE